MYRFKIYRNKGSLSSAEKEVDNIRYDRSYYSFERMITPHYTDFGWKKTKNDRVFFRTELEGEFNLVGADFDWVNAIRLDDSEADRYRILTIEVNRDSVWTEEWVGWFSIINAEFDLDNCSVKFTKFPVWDKYTPILENIEREKNFFNAPQRTINYYYDQYDYESYIETEEYSVTAGSVDPVEPTTISEIFPDTTDKYTLYSKSLRITGVNGLTCYYTITKEYRRNYNNSVANPGGDEWVNGGSVPGTNGVYHWIRWFDDYGTALLPGYNYNSVPGKTYYYGGYYVQQYTYTIKRNLPTQYENERARTLSDVMFMLVQDLSFRGLNFQPSSAFLSEFFNSATNPITGQDNKLRYLRVIQMTDAKDTSDPATRATITFKDIESWFDFLNAGWYIQDDGHMRIEHKKYFDNGLSYDDPVVGLDITANPILSKQAKATSKFRYKNTALPRVERFTLTNHEGQDFVGEPIFYRGSMANWGENNDITYTFNLSTDLQAAIDDDSRAIDGFVLLSCRYVSSTGEYWVEYGTGELSQSEVLNYPLATANVHNDYWKYGRPVISGIMNLKYTEFDSVSRNFAQEDFEITYCDDIDPYLLVKTEYGNGRIESVYQSFKDNKVTLSLVY